MSSPFSFKGFDELQSFFSKFSSSICHLIKNNIESVKIRVYNDENQDSFVEHNYQTGDNNLVKTEPSSVTTIQPTPTVEAPVVNIPNTTVAPDPVKVETPKEPEK